MDIIGLHKFMDYQTLQFQYDRIYSYFKTTTEPFDFLDWDGEILQVWNGDAMVEEYRLKDLNSMLGSSWSKFWEYRPKWMRVMKAKTKLS